MGHYEDECHIKRRGSEKLKKAEEERRKNALKVGKPEGGGPNPGGFKGKGNPGGERRSSAPSIGGRGAPNPTPKGEPSGEKRPAHSTPSAGGADKSSENAKNRRLNWRSKCLQSAGVEGTKSPVLGRPPRAPRSHPIRRGGASTRGGERHHGVREADRSTESDRTGRGAAHHAGPRGTPGRHAAGHNQGTRTGVKQQRPPGAANPESAHNTQRTRARGQVPSNTSCRPDG